MFRIKPDVKTFGRKLLLIMILLGCQIIICSISDLLSDYFSTPHWVLIPFYWLNGILTYPYSFIAEKFSLAVLKILIGPIIEELYCRAPLWLALRFKKTGQYLYDKQYLLWTIILVNGAIFGLLHLSSSLTILFHLGLSGVFYCYLVARTKSLWPSIVFHISLNLLIILLFGIQW